MMRVSRWALPFPEEVVWLAFQKTARILCEEEGATASMMHRRMLALLSLFKHLARHDAAARNPVVEVACPSINREQGTTATFSKAQNRKLLDALSPDILTGLQLELCRAEIAGLIVGNLHQNRGCNSLRLIRKGRRRDAPAINSQAVARIRA